MTQKDWRIENRWFLMLVPTQNFSKSLFSVGTTTTATKFKFQFFLEKFWFTIPRKQIKTFQTGSKQTGNKWLAVLYSVRNLYKAVFQSWKQNKKVGKWKPIWRRHNTPDLAKTIWDTKSLVWHKTWCWP